MHLRADDFKRLTTLAYSAALAPDRWQDVLEAMTEVSGGVRTHMFGFDAQAAESVVGGYSGYDPSYVDAYDTYFHQKNVWAEGFIKGDTGVPIHSEWMCSRENLYRSEFYNDWVLPQEDIVGGGGALLFKEDNRMFAFGGNIRRRDVDRLEMPWLQLVGELVPHFQQAFEISRMLASLSLEKQAIKLARDPQNAACLVINRSRRILYTDANAANLLENGALVQRDMFHRLVFADGLSNERYDRAVSAFNQSHAHHPQTIQVQARASGKPHICRIAPLEPDRLDFSPFGILLGSTEPCFLIAVSGERNGTEVHSALRARYGLTEREALVALHIADGLATRDIAEEHEVSVHTVRNQLKAAMSKLDVHRQSDLVRIVEKARAAQ